MNETNILNELTNRDRERMRGYQELLDFYNGLQWSERERYGEKRLTFNYAKVFIDKITSYLMSGVGCTVEALEDTPEAGARAEQAEKALYQVYEANNLEQLDLETEIDCAVLGDGCYKIIWSEEFGVKVTAPDIRNIYAWWAGDDISRIWRAACKYQLSEEELALLYDIRLLRGAEGLAMTGPSKMRTMVEIWTDETFELYLDNRLLESGANPYGFIPFIIFPNLREPKKFWGTSDLSQIREPQREINRAMSQISHILELSGNPVAVLENVEESTDIAVKPGAVWNIPEDAKAYLLDLLQGGGLQLHINYMELLYRILHDLSEAPRAAFGGANKNLSGVAMQIELYPLLQKIVRKRLIRTNVYNRRNRMILELLRRFQNTTDNSIFEAERYRLRTIWGQVMPQDTAQLVANEKTLVDTGIHSRRKAMDEMGVKDPEAEFRHWIEEQEVMGEVKRQKEKGKGESQK